MDPILIAYNLNWVTISQLKQGNVPLLLQEQSKQIQSFLDKYNIQGCHQGQSSYHFKFEKIYSKPYIVYRIGNIEILNYNILAIVGPRRPSSYSIQILEKLFEKLQWTKNLAIVSGLAPGVDNLAHKLSIQAWLPTIAVLGGGFDYFFQNKTKDINQIVANNGLVLSEFKLFQKPEKYTFPQRNRIIAGLADVIFVPEAGEKSGSLITVDFGLKMKKEIWWAPNNIFATTSKGLNQYISEGKVKAISDIDWFVNYLNQKLDLFENSSITTAQINLTDKEKNILEHIKNWNDNLTKLHLSSWYDMGTLMMILTQLEMKWVIRDLGGKLVVL